MGVHKLTAGNGYSYLTRQVALHDASEKGHTGLGDYYSERGRHPAGGPVRGSLGWAWRRGKMSPRPQMKALFGEGRHPNAAPLSTGVVSGSSEALPAPVLGLPFAVYHGVNEFQTAVAREFTAINLAAGRRSASPPSNQSRRCGLSSRGR